MDSDLVHPELRAPLAKLPALDPSKKIMRMLATVGPRLMTTPKVDGVTIRSVRDGDVRVRIYEPAVRSGAGLLWIHGGGLVFGSAKQDDTLCADTARALGAVVVSAEYRLAPEHPFPAAFDDGVAAWHWFQAHSAGLGVDPARIAVGGESAGAGLAASVVHRVHDDGGVQPAAQWLFAPMLDDRTAAHRELDAVAHPVWDNRANLFGWQSYLGHAPGADTVAQYSVPARRADLGGLPPTWLYTGDIELFHNEIAEYARRLGEAGVPVEFEVVPGGAHGFENWAWSTAVARELVSRAQAWLGAALAG